MHAISILRLTLIPASPTHPPNPYYGPFFAPLALFKPLPCRILPLFSVALAVGHEVKGERDLLWAKQRRHKFGSTGFFPPHNIQKLPRLGRLASKQGKGLAGPTCTNLPAAHNHHSSAEKSFWWPAKEKVIKGLIGNGRPGRVHNGDINKQPNEKNL